MKDINFWLGTGVGFASALSGAAVVAWIQYRLRIKEHNYTREQARKDREEEELARKEASRDEYMTMIKDLRPDLLDSSEWAGFVERHRKYYPNNRTFGFLNRSHVGSLVWDNDLKDMSLSELKNIYMLLVNMPISSTVLDLLNTRDEELKQIAKELSGMLNRMHSTLDVKRSQTE
jgi:hypothetical protein